MSRRYEYVEPLDEGMDSLAVIGTGLMVGVAIGLAVVKWAWRTFVN